MGSSQGEYKVGQLSALFGNTEKESDQLASLFSKPSSKRPRPTPAAAATKEKPEKSSEESEDDELDEDKKSESGEKAAEADLSNTEKDARTLFVGAIPLTKGIKQVQKMLTKHFGKFQKVESVRIRSVPIQAVAVPSGANYKLMRKASIVQGKVDTATTCNAYVVFESKDAVDAVLEADGANKIGDTQVRLDRVGMQAKDLFDRRTTVFVGNLPFTATEQQIQDFFDKKVKARVSAAIKKGKLSSADIDLEKPLVERVRVVRDRMTNMGKGFAYVCFSSNEVMESALGLHEAEFNERKVRVSRCKRSAGLARPGAGGKGKRAPETVLQQIKRVKKPRHVPRTGESSGTTGSSTSSKAVAAASASLAYQGVRANRQAAGLRIRQKQSIQQKMQQKAKASSKARAKQRHAKLKKAAKSQGKKKVPTLE